MTRRSNPVVDDPRQGLPARRMGGAQEVGHEFAPASKRHLSIARFEGDGFAEKLNPMLARGYRDLAIAVAVLAQAGSGDSTFRKPDVAEQFRPGLQRAEGVVGFTSSLSRRISALERAPCIDGH